jgi:hypothetical protein
VHDYRECCRSRHCSDHLVFHSGETVGAKHQTANSIGGVLDVCLSCLFRLKNGISGEAVRESSTQQEREAEAYDNAQISQWIAAAARKMFLDSLRVFDSEERSIAVSKPLPLHSCNSHGPHETRTHFWGGCIPIIVVFFSIKCLFAKLDNKQTPLHEMTPNSVLLPQSSCFSLGLEQA